MTREPFGWDYTSVVGESVFSVFVGDDGVVKAVSWADGVAERDGLRKSNAR